MEIKNRRRIQKGVFISILVTSQPLKSGLYFPLMAGKRSRFQWFVVLSSSLLYSKMSAGWQSNALQMDSNVLKRIAFAFPVFRIERLDNVKFTRSESSFREIFRFAIITSKFTMIGMV
jgi:hypothetical protein